MTFFDFSRKKFEIAKELIYIRKIWIGEGTSFTVRITEHFELLDFELVRFDCILKMEEKKIFPSLVINAGLLTI